MLDRVLILNQYEAVAVYTNRPAIRLKSDRDIKSFIAWFLDDTKTSLQTEAGLKAVGFKNIEDTQEIKIA